MKIKTPKILSISEARKNIFQLAEEASKPGGHIILTENGRPKVVLISAEEFESWKETLEIQTIFPNLRTDVEAARSAYAWGNYLTIDEILARDGYVLADKGQKQYGVSSNSRAPRAKRPRQNRRSAKKG